MSNPLYKQIGGNSLGNPMLQRLMQFKNGFTGNPQQMIQSMLNSGKLTQAQLNQYAQQANELYKMFKS
jgi:hypothetical protein